MKEKERTFGPSFNPFIFWIEGPFFLSFISFYRNERFPHMIDLNARTFSLFSFLLCACRSIFFWLINGLTFLRINWWHLLREIMKAINWWAHKARRMWGNLRLTVNSWPGIDGLSVDSSISCTPSIGQEVNRGSASSISCRRIPILWAGHKGLSYKPTVHEKIGIQGTGNAFLTGWSSPWNTSCH